jgi:hypothetical protein
MGSNGAQIKPVPTTTQQPNKPSQYKQYGRRLVPARAIPAAAQGQPTILMHRDRATGSDKHIKQPYILSKQP